jgi:hypothetical protein
MHQWRPDEDIKFVSRRGSRRRQELAPANLEILRCRRAAGGGM